MNWIKVIIINLVILTAMIACLEILAGFSRVILGKQYLFPKAVNVNPCEEMRTDVLLTHIPNHKGRCEIKDGYADGEYVRYDINDRTMPIIITLGGSTTSGFYQSISSGDTYPKFLSQVLASDYQVLNGGVGGYSSLQELLKVIRDAPRIKKLHTVISLNGINELPDYHGNNEVRRYAHPFLSAIQHQMNNQQTWIDQRQSLFVFSILPNLHSFIKFLAKEAPFEPNEVNSSISDPVILDAAARWLSNVTRTHAVLHSQGVRYFVFLQPTMGLIGTQSSPPKHTRDAELFELLSDKYIDEIRTLYSELKQHCSELSYCFDISNEAAPTGNIYNDPRHHNSEGNKILAEVIAEKIVKQDNLSLGSD